MTDKQTAPQQAGDLVEVENFAPQASLLDSIISQSRVARSDTERNRTRDLILQRRDGNEFPATLLVVSDRIGGEWMVSFFVRDRSGDDGTGMPA